VLRWLEATPRLGVPGGRVFQETTVGNYGSLYGLLFLILTVAAITGLIARYRKVGVA
jgi:hypothetical protein